MVSLPVIEIPEPEPNVTEAVFVPEPTTPEPVAVGCVCNTDRIWMELDNIKSMFLFSTDLYADWLL